MKRFLPLSYPLLACLIAAAAFFSSNDAHATRLLEDSFENFDGNGDPNGWGVAGHPSYLRVRNENEGNWSTPDGEWALQTYSSGIATRTVGVIPDFVSEENDGSGDLILNFNLSSFATIGEYRAEIWVIPFLSDPILVAHIAGDTDGSKDMSYSDFVFWRYEYEDWPDPDFPGFGLLEGAEIQVKLMQDPLRGNWRHTPVWDNVTVDFIPDVDTDPPELQGITDDNGGGLFVATNATVTYTVTFDEPMNPTTVNTADFENAGSSNATIQSVTATADAAVYIVEVIPTTEGSLRLGIASVAALEDTSGNLLNTSSGTTQDLETFTVESGTPIILPTDFVDDQGGGPIAEDTLVTYTLTFSKDMDASTVTAGDFDNAGTATITFGTITETTDGVFTVEVTPTDSGTLQLRIKQNVDIKAADGGELNTDTAILDDTSIIVDSDPPVVDNIADDSEGSPISVGTLLTYEVFFSEDIDGSTVDASDFGNAITSGDASFTIDTIEEDSGVVRIEITPTSAGTIQLQVNSGATIQDEVGNDYDSISAYVDDVVVTVEAASGDPYSTWSGGSAPFGDDANEDGIKNGLAWLLGASDVDEDATSLLPSATVNSSGDLILSFRCLKAANRGGVSAKVQYSNDMGATDDWSSNEAEVPDADSTVNGIVFDTTDDGNYINVTATIPASAAAPDGTLFGRFQGVAP